jgi:uncharacterized protein YdaU (DUF1376 family)
MATNKSDIWMPLYIGDYLADTIHLSTEQHGAYLLMLMFYWKNGPLPNDPATLQQITKLSADAWENQQAVLLNFFTVGSDRLHQKRADSERAKRQRNQSGGQVRAEGATRDGGKFTSQTPATPPAKHQPNTSQKTRVRQTNFHAAPAKHHHPHQPNVKKGKNHQPNHQQKPAIPQPQSQKTKDDDDRAPERKPSGNGKSSSSFSVVSLQAFWNQHRSVMRESTSITYLEGLFVDRVKDGLTEELAHQAILKMAASPYCRGEVDGTLGDLEWLLEVDKKSGEPNFRKVLKGKYEQRKKKKSVVKEMPSYWEARQS